MISVQVLVWLEGSPHQVDGTPLMTTVSRRAVRGVAAEAQASEMVTIAAQEARDNLLERMVQGG